MKGIKNQNYELNFLFYGQSGMHQPRIYKNQFSDLNFKKQVLPSYRFMRSDMNYVWSSEFGNFLIEHCITNKFKVVNPILFYKNKISTNFKPKKCNITIFDIGLKFS